MPPHDRPRLFYGWVILAASFGSFATAAGLMHAYTVFFVAFLDEFGWSRAETSVAYAVSQLLSGASAPFVGMLSDRLGPRTLVLLGGSILAVGLVASACVVSFGQLIVVYGVVMTLGAHGLGLVVFVPLLSRWFVRRRGLVLALVQSANGLGRALSAPLVQFLIATLGWRRAYLVLAVGLGVLLGPLVWCLRARTPAEMGFAPDGDPLTCRVWVPARAGARSAYRARTGGWRRRSVRPISGGSWRSTCARAWAVSWCRCTSWPLPSMWASSPCMRPVCSASGSFLAMGGTIGTGALSDYIGRERAAILAYGISILGVCCALGIFERPADLAPLAPCLLLWADLGRPGSRHYRQDGRPLSRYAGGHDSRGDHHWHGRGLCRGVLGQWLDLRSLRQLPPGLSAVHCVLSWGLCRLLVVASSPGALAGAVASVPVRYM